MSKFLGKMSTSVAHTSKMPMLGPKDLRLLGNIINTEKGVMTSMSTLSAETHKAAEALRVWGKIEGDDLGDVLGKITILLDQLSTAENKYAEHNATYRQYFKAVRTREEALVQLKKTKESVAARIEALEKKLSKMNPEHKDAPGLHVKLRETRSELSGLDFAVMNEEARLGDFKRETTREAMGLKLGALLEMSEKSTIIAELGKLLLEEIPRDRTEPGNPRVLYRGWTRTDEILDEAKRCLQEVVFNPSPGGTIGGGVPPLNREESPAGGRDTALATENQENGHHPEPTNATSDWEMVSKHQQLPSSISYAPPPQPQGNQDVYENHHMSIYGGLNSDPYTHQDYSAPPVPPLPSGNQYAPPSHPPPPPAGPQSGQGIHRESTYGSGPTDLPYSRPTGIEGYNPDLDSQYPQFRKSEEQTQPQRPYAPRHPAAPLPEQDSFHTPPTQPPQSPNSPIPPSPRFNNRRDSALGSKYGYDMSTAPAPNDYRSMTYDTYSTPRAEMGYNPAGYARPGEASSLGVGEGRKMPASAFMRKVSSPVYSSPNPAPSGSSGPTPAERIREEWRRTSHSGPIPGFNSQIDTTLPPIVTTTDGEVVESPSTAPLQIRKKDSSLPLLPIDAPDEARSYHSGATSPRIRTSNDLPALPPYPASSNGHGSDYQSQRPQQVYSTPEPPTSPLRIVPVTRLD